MSALRQPDFSTDYYYPPVQPNQAVHQPNIVSRSPNPPAKLVKSKAFHDSTTLPQNLKTLSLIQKGSFAVAIATMTASISLYASTVKIPKLWSQEYQHLEDLQLQERQLIAVNESIKYQIAQEAAQDKHLSISKPESAIFISPAKVAPRKPVDLEQNQQQIAELKYNSLGY
ncbi:MAG: hypothetical protein RLZZ04_722 [Cyanobacteriota bacterium]|jgi:hypothetical protein